MRTGGFFRSAPNRKKPPFPEIRDHSNKAPPAVHIQDVIIKKEIPAIQWKRHKGSNSKRYPPHCSIIRYFLKISTRSEGIQPWGLKCPKEINRIN